MIIAEDIIQGTPEWLQAKLGVPSASNFDRLLTSKGAISKSREGYLNELIAERITGQSTYHRITDEMAEGTRREHESRQFFELIHGVEIKQVGMIYPDEEKRYLVSPDGLEKRFGLELKNPLAKTVVEYKRSSVFPNKYILQVQGSLLVSGFDYWWFMAYHSPELFFEIKVYRDEELIKKLKEALDAFCLELAIATKKLKELGG